MTRPWSATPRSAARSRCGNGSAMSQQLRSATDCVVGERFAKALAAKDAEALRAVLADQIDFQALTPGRHWQANAPGVVIDEIVLGKWFEPGNDIQALET